MSEGEEVPRHGQWPVDPQEDQPVSEDRIWVDGCFDFSHHGHAGAMLQARRLGTELYVGVHSDAAILANKGPTVMALAERVAAVDACRWVTQSVPHAPYVTSLAWISHYGCRFVGHGDDVTSDGAGGDCYRHVKRAGRFRVFRRTPGISTTDLVGRMLLCTRAHFVRSLAAVLEGREGPGSDEERRERGVEMRTRIAEYASDSTGKYPGPEVWTWADDPSDDDSKGLGTFTSMVEGKAPLPDQRVVYVDGGFDLFSSGHIEFLRQVTLVEEQRHGQKAPPFLIVGIHDDEVINEWKGVNYPIMNIFERGLCVLQCRYVHAVIFGAPFTPNTKYLHDLPHGTPSAVYHGPTSFMPSKHDPYADAKAIGIYNEIGTHAFQHVNAGEIVGRIMASRADFEERQRRKGEKAVGEEAVQRREQLEQEAAQRAKGQDGHS